MLVQLVIGFFIVSAIVLFWLGRAPRDPIARGSIEAGMSEADVIATVGPPQEILRTRDPLDPGFFTNSRRETYIYANERAVYFERGHVVRVGQRADAGNPTKPPAQIIANQADQAVQEPANSARPEDHQPSEPTTSPEQ